MAPSRVQAVPVSRDRLWHVISDLRARDHKEIYALRYDNDPVAFFEEQMILMGKMCIIWERNGIPVSVQGVIPHWPGVWSMFAYGTDDWPRVVLSMTRWARRFVMPIMSQVAHRVEARALADHTESRRWIESFGACEECVLREYGRNREDFILYVWKPS